MQQNTVILVPGLGGSGPDHWQTLWQQQYPHFDRVQQQEWERPNRADWVEALQSTVQKYKTWQVVLVAHSLGCIALAFWAQKYKAHIRGVLLVAPADTEAAAFPEEVKGFKPIPMERLPFRGIVVSSINDDYISAGRAQQLASAWGSQYVNIGMAGHINSASGYGRWDEGLELLKGLCGVSRF